MQTWQGNICIENYIFVYQKLTWNWTAWVLRLLNLSTLKRQNSQTILAKFGRNYFLSCLMMAPRDLQTFLSCRVSWETESEDYCIIL